MVHTIVIITISDIDAQLQGGYDGSGGVVMFEKTAVPDDATQFAVLPPQVQVNVRESDGMFEASS